MIDKNRASAIRLINRVYWPRIIGLAFACLAIFIKFYQDGAPLWQWLLLTFFCFAWPHIAHIWAKNSQYPRRSEVINLFIDAFMLGFWVPIISFNLVPSFAIIGMHLLSIISVFGARIAFFGFITECFGMLIGVAFVGFSVELNTDVSIILASLPMLFFYPLFVGNNGYLLSVKLSEKQKVLRKLSRIDALTGLSNRMYLEEQLEQLFKRNKREKTKASFIFIDVDHFKVVNDDYGHIVGDEVLKQVAFHIKSCAREIDICGRYGGEEFCILMPNTNKVDAEKLAERLRLKIATSILHENCQIRGSISLGVAEISDEMHCYNDWLKIADQAQYQAKKQGRNQTVVAISA